MVNFRKEPRVELVEFASKPPKYLWPIQTFSPRVEKKIWAAD